MPNLPEDSIDSALFQENERTSSVGQPKEVVSVGELHLRAGGYLPDVEVAYESWGTLNSDASNAILICHALSGDSHAIGWWDRLVGPGKAIDTEKYFVVCSNALGGCQGTTGPASSAEDGRPYGSRFPVVQVEDMVEIQARLADHLGIGRWLCVAGGSMGGMQALCWAVQYPNRVAGVWATASCAAHSAMQIGFNEVGRQAIQRDPEWKGGDYYDGPGPVNGLSVARMAGHLSYLSDQSFTMKFGRRLQDGDEFRFDNGIEFAIESYLNYQGDKFTNRFDANSYLLLTRAIDYFSLKSLESAKCKFLFTSFDSDWIYPSHQIEQLHAMAQEAGKQSEWHEIASPMGHDSFLLDDQRQAEIVKAWLLRF
ncbi:MAG: homoserine O-acetyltransferase [Fimbriimonadaceae bacterium]|nr:MAG: homoserine O-acetyltransferase [Fimbriimonadaceae bacterium]